MRSTLMGLEGRPYPAYRALTGRAFDIGVGTLTFVHVQPDPFAAASRVQIVLLAATVGLLTEDFGLPTARRAAADFFHRGIVTALRAIAHDALRIVDLGPEILERTAVSIGAQGDMTIRLTVALPAAGRRILGRAAATLLADALPRALTAACVDYDRTALRTHVTGVEDQVALREQLAARGLVAFLADGSVLPRRSGVDERPLPDAVVLQAPDSLAVILTAPHAGSIRGLGIPVGVTLLVGGGYHGKSTLLAAIVTGIYDHLAGDGRERCVTRATAVCIRAEDGRSVRGVDLRPFITHLPFGRRTDA